MINFTEKEYRTIEAVFDSLAHLDWDEANKFLGSMTIKEMLVLNNKMRYDGYCKRHGISYEEMTEDDFIDVALEDAETHGYAV